MSDLAAPIHIAVSGLIGAGKSTLTKALAAALGCDAYYEFVGENPYLAKFYADPKQYGFGLQIHLLNQRFAQQQQIVWSRRGAVQDRSIYEDQVFCKMLMRAGLISELDYATYVTLFRNMAHFMRQPTLLVHLDVTPEQSLERIRTRGRECEAGIDLGYLQRLHAGYEEFLAEISRTIPVVRVDWSKFHDADAVAARIKEKCADMRNISVIKLE